jgi:hypothetical protein
MRDKSHGDQIERWARYVKENSDWKQKQKPFINSQIIIARRTYKKLLSLPNGKEKIQRLRKINS